MTRRNITFPEETKYVKEEHRKDVLDDVRQDGALPENIAAVHKDGLSIKEITGASDIEYEDDTIYSIEILPSDLEA